MTSTLFLFAMLSLPGAALAQEAAPAASPATAPDAASDDARMRLIAQLTVGGRLPLSDLGTGLLPTAEVGVRWPFAGQRLTTAATFSYSWSSATGAGTDDRLPGDGNWSWTLRQREWVLGAVAVGRLFDPDDKSWSPELAIGPQWHHQVSFSDGASGGESFGEYREQAERFGFMAALGLGLALGPGEGVVRLGMTGSTLNGTLSGKSSGTMGPFGAIGYRLVL